MPDAIIMNAMGQAAGAEAKGNRPSHAWNGVWREAKGNAASGNGVSVMLRMLGAPAHMNGRKRQWHRLLTARAIPRPWEPALGFDSGARTPVQKSRTCPAKAA